MHITFKTILNRIQPLNGFVFSDERIRDDCRRLTIDVTIREHRQREAICPECEKACPTYDHLPERQWQYVPCLGLAVFFHYAPRRVSCPEHGILVEEIPWSDGKRPYCRPMMQFLGNWARRLSWKETAATFKVSWQAVYRSVDWMVDWGLKHRNLDGITAIGIDEIHVGHGKKSLNYLTVIYEIDAHCRRLLWVGPKRTATTLRKGLAALGELVLNGIQFVCSDMWKAYLKVVKTRLQQA